MMNRLPPVHALSAFEAAARLGSFAEAADELCITPSALSHRIRLLEEFVGERLFAREARNLPLTEFGRRYLEVVRNALRALSEFPLPQHSASKATRVKLTVPPTFARCLLIPRLADFTRRYPHITLDIFLSVPLYDLSLSESDLEVRFGAGQYPRLETSKLFDEPVFAVASPDYLKSIGGLKTPADLTRAQLIRSALEPWQPWFAAAGLDWAEPTTGLRVDDLGLVLEAVVHGHGVGLTREHFARELIARGQLQALFEVRLQTSPHAYYLVYERSASERPGVAELIAWMNETYRENTA